MPIQIKNIQLIKDDEIEIVDVINDKSYSIVKGSGYSIEMGDDGFKLNKDNNTIEIRLVNNSAHDIYVFDIKNKTITKK